MFVRCPKCGNNCCSGGFGEVTEEGLPKAKLGDKGVTCDVCNLCYQYQDLAYKAKLAPKRPSVKERTKARKKLDRALESLAK